MKQLVLIFICVALGLVKSADAACSARFDGAPYTFLPSYNPFSPTDLAVSKTIQIANLSGDGCRYRVYFRRSPATGQFSPKLHYDLTDNLNQLLLVENVGSGSYRYLVSPAASGYVYRSIAFNVVIARGQIAAPSVLGDRIELFLFSEDGQTQLDQRYFDFWISVPSISMINLAGGGLATSVQFNTLVTGMTRSLILEARSNTGYTISFASSNQGNMMLDPPIAGHTWLIPYQMKVDGAQFDLSGQSTLQGVSPASGEQSHSLSFQIVDAERKRAGTYKDVITVQIAPIP